MDRTCSDCTVPISVHSKGRCRRCALAVTRAGPANERRLAGLRAALSDPEYRKRKSVEAVERHAKRADDPQWQAYLHEAGKQLRARFEANPEAVERQRASRATVGATLKAVWLPWCPPERYDEYKRLRRKVGAAEARRVIEDEIAGTVEHARRAVANSQLKMELRHLHQQLAGECRHR